MAYENSYFIRSRQRAASSNKILRQMITFIVPNHASEQAKGKEKPALHRIESCPKTSQKYSGPRTRRYTGKTRGTGL